MTEMKHYMTDRRKYERPTTRVIELQHRTMILAGSGNVGATNSIEDWGNGGTDTEDIYM